MEATALMASGEDEIRDLMDRYFDAIRASDVEAIVSFYTPGIVAFDAIGALRFSGRDAYKAHWAACMEMCTGMSNMIFEMHDLALSVGQNQAFGHYLVRCGGTMPDGEKKVGWMRATVGLERQVGRWLIAHEHFSAPFDPASEKALLGLEP